MDKFKLWAIIIVLVLGIGLYVSISGWIKNHHQYNQCKQGLLGDVDSLNQVITNLQGQLGIPYIETLIVIKPKPYPKPETTVVAETSYVMDTTWLPSGDTSGCNLLVKFHDTQPLFGLNGYASCKNGKTTLIYKYTDEYNKFKVYDKNPWVFKGGLGYSPQEGIGGMIGMGKRKWGIMITGDKHEQTMWLTRNF